MIKRPAMAMEQAADIEFLSLSEHLKLPSYLFNYFPFISQHLLANNV